MRAAHTFFPLISAVVVAGLLSGARTGLDAQQPAATEAAADVVDADTRLIRAAMHGSIADVRTALEAGAHLEATTDSGVTPLSSAALHGHAEVVGALLEAGANITATDTTGATALMFAAAQGHARVVELLAGRGADVNVRDKNQMSALMAAGSAGRVEVVRALLARKADANATDAQGATALMAAAFGGHTAAGEALIAGDADVNVRDESGRTALMATALGGDTVLARALIAAKADVAIADLAGSTALTYAASNGRGAMVELLMKAGLKRDLDAALSFAVRGCHTDIARTLRSNGAAIDRSVQGTPPVVLAAASNCDDTLRYLLDSGADINAKAEKDGMTALMAAAALGLVPIGELLIARGADSEARNSQDQTAWSYAAMNKHQEFVELLRKVRDNR